jgi:2-(1,2-epoxy-1,2-dihydrophenyl)acetyl-CoA isomerase
MTYQTISVAHDSGVATVTLNRPDKLNSFTVEMHRELRDAIAGVEHDRSVRVLVLTGAGRGFCAGQDLGARAGGSGPIDLGATLEEWYNPLIRSLAALPLPVIASVNGVAAGAGANLALAADIVIAARSARFIQAFAKIGLVPDSGGTFFLPRAIGTPRALALALTAEPLAAEQAAEWGLIWKCVDDAALPSETQALAVQLAAMPSHALGLIKRAIRQSATHTLDQQLDLERDLQRETGRSDDYREGVAAFLEKRAPKFGGRL